MRTHRLLVVLIGLALCAVALNAAADDYYIDPVNGSDSTGDGSQESPWKTLTYANEQTKCQGTEGNPVVLHALAGVYSPSTNGDTFPILFYQYPIDQVPHFGVLAGAGRDVTILHAEGTDRVLKTSGYEITVADLTVTGGADPVYHSGGGGIGASIGAITGSNGSLMIERCVIRDNIDGYGLQVSNSGPVRITDCEFTGNIGPNDNYGAAMRFYVQQGVTMTNCLIANNSVYDPSFEGGGPMFYGGSSVMLINCTIVDNDNQGVHGAGVTGYIKLYNCVLWGHEDDIYIGGTMSVEIYHCNIEDGDGAGSNGNISQDPLFVTGAQGNYYLSHAGVNSKKEDKKAK